MMPYKTILIHAAKEQRFQSLLTIGVDLAVRFQSHLMALAVLPPAIRIPAGVPGASDVVRIDTHRTAFLDDAQRMAATFDRSTSGQKLTADWHIDDPGEGAAEPAILDYARTADLLICGAPDAATHGIARQNLTERLILGAGRPVLVVPKSKTPVAPVGGRVLVAWNGSREATRATFDALPILQTARSVKIMSIGEGGGSEARSPDQLCDILSRHDVRAKPEAMALPGADVGQAILSCVKAENADLLVMGCYGRPRLYEYALGGATRHVLHEAAVPVLMSH